MWVGCCLGERERKNKVPTTSTARMTSKINRDMTAVVTHGATKEKIDVVNNVPCVCCDSVLQTENDSDCECGGIRENVRLICI